MLYFFKTALRTWGRFIILLTEDYNHLSISATNCEPSDTNESGTNKPIKWSSEPEVKQYLEETKRTVVWYKETDKKLRDVFIKFYNLTQHPHLKIRLELAQVCSSLIEKCLRYVKML